MATALDTIKRSMRLIGALGDGEAPTASEGIDCLAALNSMLDSWWAKTLAVFYTKDETFTWASGQASRTMGAGGNFSTTRPARIAGAYQRDNNNDTPIVILDNRSQYDGISNKTSQSTLIEMIYPEYQAALVHLYAYPVPSTSLSVHIQSLARLQSFSTLATDVAMPPGYQRALEYNLAVEISPEFQIDPPVLVVRNAQTSLRLIKRANLELAPMQTETAYLGSGRPSYNINTDG